MDFAFNCSFDEYITKVYSCLCCNITEEERNREYISCYDFTEEEVNKNISYFRECYNSGLSAYKALLFFYDFLIEKKYG